MKKLDTWGWVSLILVLAGALNLGIYGLGAVNILGIFFGAGFLSRLLYIAIGAGAVYLIYFLFVKKD